MLAAAIGLTAALLAASSAFALPPSLVNSARQTTVSDTPVHKVAVFGKDNRTKLPKRLDGLKSSIGLLYNERSQTVCSAFCVADDVIATASHCIYRTKGQTPPPADSFYFARPGTRYGNVRFAGHASRTASHNILAGTIGISTKPPIDAARDWALVKLQGPACRGNRLGMQPLAPDDIEREAAAGRLFQVAFHRDFNQWSLGYSEPCLGGRKVEGVGGPVTDRDFSDASNLVLHVCDTGGASSGSPLLIDTPAGPQVVAINVGTYVQSRVIIEEGQVIKRAPAKPVANTAVSAIAFAGRMEELRATMILSAAGDILDLKRRLAEQDLLDGPLDGRFDARLRIAIETYEMRNDLSVTGLPTRALLQRLQQSVPAR